MFEEENKTLWKRVVVADLPLGYCKEHFISMAKVPGVTEVIVVASMGYANDWSCYIGWPLELNPYGKMMDATGYYQEAFSTWQGVAMHGDKLSRTEAYALFPEISSELHYRN